MPLAANPGFLLGGESFKNLGEGFGGFGGGHGGSYPGDYFFCCPMGYSNHWSGGCR